MVRKAEHKRDDVQDTKFYVKRVGFDANLNPLIEVPKFGINATKIGISKARAN